MKTENQTVTTNDVTNTGAPQNNSDLTNVHNYIYDPNGFKKDLEIFSKFKDRKTGFSNLDQEIFGLPPALYILEACSRFGKSSFYLQIACQLALAGEYVLFFAFEQMRYELTAKCISRETATSTKNNNPAFGRAVSAKNIMFGAITEEVKEAMKTFGEKIGDKLHIIECNMNSTASSINSYIETWINKHNGIVPIVFVDYLQIIPQDAKSVLSERAAVDHNLAVLKSFQKKHSLAMFLICSLNRAGYYTTVSMESNKESGNIEYTADFLWGLQLVVMSSEQYRAATNEERKNMVDEAMKEIPRKMKLVSLKCRNGNGNFECDFKYFPPFDLFIPDTEFCPVFENEYNPFSELYDQAELDLETP